MTRSTMLMSRLAGLRTHLDPAALQRLARQAGWAGALGAALLVLALAGGAISRAQIEEARQRLAGERGRLAQAAVVARVDLRSDRERIAAYYAERFPAESVVAERLGLLYGKAGEHGIEIRRVDYRSIKEPGSPLRRIALTVPVQGEFPHIHGWLSAVLMDMPELGLEALSIKRNGSEASTLEAELRLMVYVRAGQ